MLVKQATQEDIPRILEMYKAGLEETGRDDWRESFLIKKITTCLHLAPCLLLVINGKIQGMMGLTIVRLSHNGDASLADYILYIEPKFRSIKTLGALVKSAQEFADSHDMPLRVDFIVKEDLAKRVRLLTMHGFKVNTVSGAYNE